MHNFENKASFTLGEERDKPNSQDRAEKLKVWTWGFHKSPERRSGCHHAFDIA